ncbi:MAG: hypothetical protein JWO31_3038 [Phycisphaerales bacterium]|nr:hypothetical protein [Phycisphaerales bacterium]
MTDLPYKGSHSADVRIWLDCGVHGLLDLARVTPTSVEAVAPRDIPPCPAELVVTLDGRCLRSPVYLRSGVAEGSRDALVSPADDAAPF